MAEDDTIVNLRNRISELESRLIESNKRLEDLDVVDTLTGSLNNKGLNQAFLRELNLSRRKNIHLSVMMVNVDNVAEIQDEYGIQGSSVAIKEISQGLFSLLRSTDHIGRMKNGEFVILLPDTRVAEGMRTAKKVKSKLSKSTVVLSSGKTFKAETTVSVIGVTEDISTFDEALSRAGLIISKGKRNNQLSGDKDIFGEKSFGAHDLQSVLEQLLSGECFKPVIQPIFDVTKASKIGYEILSRSRIKGFELPDDFFPLCFGSDALSSVDYNCFKSCLFRSIPVFPGLKRHLNIFPVTLIEVPAKKLLREFPAFVPMEDYCLEISEQHIVGEPSYLTGYLNVFRKEGIKIALDDVGFGHSSLESLIVLEPDVIKIDRTYIHNISRDSFKERSIKRLIRLVQGLGVEIVVAEGVESEEDLELLKSLGIKYAQGNLLGQPA